MSVWQAADCYAFGILMWEMYTSTCAWLNMSHAQVVRAVLTNRKLAWPSDVPDAYRCADSSSQQPLSLQCANLRTPIVVCMFRI